MRKFKSIALVLVLALFAVVAIGCANTEKVKEELCGGWGYYVSSIDGPCYKIYVFSDDDTYESLWENENAPSKNSYSSGTYKITNSKIILTEEDGDKNELEYTFEDDELSIADGSHDLIKIED